MLVTSYDICLWYKNHSRLGHMYENVNLLQMSRCTFDQAEKLWSLQFFVQKLSISGNKWVILTHQTALWAADIKGSQVDKEHSEWYHLAIVITRYLDVNFHWCRQFISMGIQQSKLRVIIFFITDCFIGLKMKDFSLFSYKKICIFCLEFSSPLFLSLFHFLFPSLCFSFPCFPFLFPHFHLLFPLLLLLLVRFWILTCLAERFWFAPFLTRSLGPKLW